MVKYIHYALQIYQIPLIKAIGQTCVIFVHILCPLILSSENKIKSLRSDTGIHGKATTQIDRRIEKDLTISFYTLYDVPLLSL